MLGTLALAPRSVALRAGSLYARALDLLSPRLRRVAQQNLACVLPDLPVTERGELIDHIFSSIGRMLVTFARFPKITPQTASAWIRCENLEYVTDALARGKGLLFATGHLGNWELSAFAFALLQQPIHIVVRPLDNPLIDAFVDRYRGLSGNRSINKRDYARGILQALARNEMVGVLADQHVQDGVIINFFGRPAATSAGIARFAARTGAAVVPGFALWSDLESKYVLRFLPPVEITGDPRADTQRIQSAIEQVVREYPDQWLWIHRRWKS